MCLLLQYNWNIPPDGSFKQNHFHVPIIKVKTKQEHPNQVFWHYWKETSWHESFTAPPSNIIHTGGILTKLCFLRENVAAGILHSSLCSLLRVLWGKLGPGEQSLPHTPCRLPQIQAVPLLHFHWNFCSCLARFWGEMRIWGAASKQNSGLWKA